MKQIILVFTMVIGFVTVSPVFAGTTELAKQLTAEKVSKDFIDKFTVKIKDLNDQREMRRILSSWKPVPGILIHEDPYGMQVFGDNFMLMSIKVISHKPLMLKVNDLPAFTVEGGVMASYKKWKKSLGVKNASILERWFGALVPDAFAEATMKANEKMLLLFSSQLTPVVGPGGYQSRGGHVLTPPMGPLQSLWQSAFAGVPEVKCDSDPIEGRGRIEDGKSDVVKSKEYEVQFKAFKDSRVVLTSKDKSYQIQLAKAPKEGVDNPAFRRLEQCRFSTYVSEVEDFKKFNAAYEKMAASKDDVLLESLKSTRLTKIEAATEALNRNARTYRIRCEQLRGFSDFNARDLKMADLNCDAKQPVPVWGDPKTGNEILSIAKQIQLLNTFDYDKAKIMDKQLEEQCREFASRFEGNVVGDGEMTILECEDTKCTKTKSSPSVDPSEDIFHGLTGTNSINSFQRDDRKKAIRSLALDAISTVNCCAQKPCVDAFNANNKANAKLIPQETPPAVAK